MLTVQPPLTDIHTSTDHNKLFSISQISQTQLWKQNTDELPDTLLIHGVVHLWMGALSLGLYGAPMISDGGPGHI